MQTETIAARSRQELLRRNEVCDAFFTAQAPRLSLACHEMSRRFLAGGRLLAFGRGPAATDAQHVSVEFVHPVIVGKRALPALDVGPEFEDRLPVIVRPRDMVVGFSFAPWIAHTPVTGVARHSSDVARQGTDAGVPPGDLGRQRRSREHDAVEDALRIAQDHGALTFALGGDVGDYPFALPDADPFVCQEVFEVLYHMLWETVHVYFEHREQGHDVGASSFLYPFLGRQEQQLDTVVTDVRGSMLQKMAEVNALRSAVAETAATSMALIAAAIAARLKRGGKLITFGNGGSATDANDLTIDCVAPPPDLVPIPAISLAAEPATITAIANDIGSDAVFTRQLIAHAQPADVAIAISTSGGSANILAALAEARKRGLLTVALVGYDGGRIVSERLADHAVVVGSDYIPRIQEAHASAYHVLRRRIDEQL